MPQSYAALYCHLVYSTKRRHRWIRKEVEERLYRYLRGILRSKKSLLLEGGGTEDHIHLLVSLHRSIAVSSLANHLKANSSRWIHTEFPQLRDFAWQDGYGAFSVSPSQVERVRRYIQRQKRHHRRIDFDTEWRKLVQLNGVEEE